VEDAGRRARDIARERGAFLAATFSEPYRLEGKKTAWLEVFDQMGVSGAMTLPRTIVMPVGGGVAAIAAAKAAEEIAALGWVVGDPPRLVGVQAVRCAPIARAFQRGDEDVTPWTDDPATVAAGLRVPAPSEGRLVLDSIRSSRGALIAVSEQEIVESVRTLASTEGIFACPEGAATLAAAKRLAACGRLEGPAVLYNTGSGIKYGTALAASIPA
jgi:threonine synthase